MRGRRALSDTAPFVWSQEIAMPHPAAALRMICAALAGAAALAQAAPPAPPVAPVKPVADTYFGTTVTDTYRYMEDLSNPEVQQWARGQADYARAVLDAIPGRAPLLKRIEALEASVAARIVGVHVLPTGQVFYQKRGASDNQFKLYVRQGFDGAERLLVDPEAMAKAAGGAPQAIDFYQPSPGGRYVAYGVSQGGSEESQIHVIDTATAKDLIAPIPRTHYSEAWWMPDESGFFYFGQRELAPGAPATDKYKRQLAYFHRMRGHGPDQVVLEAGKADHLPVGEAEFPAVSPVLGTRWVVAVPGNGVQNEIALYAAPLGRALDPKLKWRRLFDRDADVTAFAIHGDDLYLLTHKNASRYKVVKTSMTHPDLEQAHVVVAPGREVVTGISAAKDGLYVQARDGTVGKLYRVAWTPDAQPQPVALPTAGAVTVDDADPRLPGALVSVSSWTHDVVYYAPDRRTGAFVDTGLQPASPYGAPDSIEAKEVLVKSWDNVQIPLSIVAPKGIKLDGGNPTVLYGYGAYGVTDDPFYLPRYLAWYELGGVRATCHVRGGGAYGEDWHLAGKQENKPNTWKDFIACAEYLVKEGYTTPARLAIHGGSAGGILIGRAMTARPDLFAVAVPEVGVLNTLRSETSANGVPNIPEFGTVADHRQFDSLLEMDAFHHVVDGTRYPAVLLMHGINDPRVPPWESFKTAARLQAATASGKPVLMRIDYAAGHGIGSTKTQRQEQYADMWSFMLWQFGDPRFQPAAEAK
jgi:prolyl oligopeptidase